MTTIVNAGAYCMYGRRKPNIIMPVCSLCPVKGRRFVVEISVAATSERGQRRPGWMVKTENSVAPPVFQTPLERVLELVLVRP